MEPSPQLSPNIKGLALCPQNGALGIPVFPILWHIPERTLEQRRRPLLKTCAVVVVVAELCLMAAERAATQWNISNVKERPVNIVHLAPPG
ncbi:MAG TPA: hypothetical protein VEG65_02940 [Candidatus Bathyarchaeia archaeon]|nr:hypothetical protein [Candidatus Bathyarchaeia archaeon]